MSVTKDEITTTLAKGIYEEKSSFLSISSYLFFWMIFVACVVGFAFKKISVAVNKAIDNVEVVLKPTMTLAQIQEKLDKAKSGSSFVLKKGVYYGKLFIKDKQNILLRGEDDVRIENGGNVFQIHNCQNIQLKNFQLEGIDKKAKEGIISVSRGSELLLEKITFSGNMIGITLVNVDQVQLNQCKLNELRAGIKIQKSQKIFFQNCELKSNRDYALHFSEHSDLTLMEGNVIQNNEGTGIHGLDSRISITASNQIINNANGIVLEECQNCEFQSSEIRKNSNDGLLLKKCINILIEKNTFSENPGNGIFIEDSDVKVRGNILIKNGKGLVLKGRNTKAIIVNNTIQENLTFGIFIQRSAKFGTVPPEQLRSLNAFENNNPDIVIK